MSNRKENVSKSEGLAALPGSGKAVDYLLVLKPEKRDFPVNKDADLTIFAIERRSVVILPELDTIHSGTSFKSQFSNHWIGSFLQELNLVLNSGKERIVFHEDWSTGTLVYFQLTAFIHGGDLLLSIRDVSYLRINLQRQQARHLQQMLETTVKTLIHEVRNNLSSISMAEENLRNISNGLHNGMLDIIDKNISEVNEQLTDLTYILSRPQADRKDHSVDEIVRQIAEDLKENISFNNTGIELDLNAGHFQVSADMRLMRLALFHLLDAINSMHRHEGVTLYLKTFSTRHSSSIVIMDEGPGVSGFSSKKSYIPYNTEYDPELRSGLALSQNIITSHGGIIYMNKWPNTGSQVIISLPVVE